MAEPWSPQPGALYVSEYGHVAHVFACTDSRFNGYARTLVARCGAMHLPSWRAATDSDPRCRRCAERGGEERERG